jgi:beta-glucosidase
MELDPAAGRGGRRRFPSRTAAAGFLAVVLPVTLAVAGGLSQPAATSPAATASCPWLGQSRSASQRVSLLLARMTLADKISMVTGAGNIAAIPRLCVPAMNLQDGPNGVGDGLTGVTQLPAGVSLAATWDRSLAAAYGKVIGAEERGKGKTVNLGRR